MRVNFYEQKYGNRSSSKLLDVTNILPVLTIVEVNF